MAGLGVVHRAARRAWHTSAGASGAQCLCFQELRTPTVSRGTPASAHLFTGLISGRLRIWRRSGSSHKKILQTVCVPAFEWSCDVGVPTDRVANAKISGSRIGHLTFDQPPAMIESQFPGGSFVLGRRKRSQVGRYAALILQFQRCHAPAKRDEPQVLVGHRRDADQAHIAA
jgi:hypothetical protein